jgi:hypothetical protein
MKTLLFVALALLLTLPTTLNAQVQMTGNPSCSDISPVTDRGFKLEPPQSGTNVIPLIGTIVTTVSDKKVLAWTNAPNFVRAVIVKGGTDSNVYFYNPTVSGASGLVAPQVNGNVTDISHIQYCYNLVTTAADVEIVGQVTDANKRNVANVRVQAAFGDTTLYGLTNPFGYFKLTGIPAGTGVTLNFSAKGYQTKSQFVILSDNMEDFSLVMERIQ